MIKPFFFYSPSPLSVHPSDIRMPSTYKNFAAGLCGNYDGSRRNEYMMPNGRLARNLDEFGQSWRVDERQARGLKTSEHPYSVHVHR